MFIKFLVLGGVFWVGGGGGSADSVFMGAGISLKLAMLRHHWSKNPIARNRGVSLR